MTPSGNESQRGWLLLTIAFTLLVAVPPVWSARWQLLDDGVLVEPLLKEWNSPMNRMFRDMGRNFYLQGQYYELLRPLAGDGVRAYYAANSAFFAFSSLLIYSLAFRVTQRGRYAALASFFFVFSSATPESIYTMFKPEVRATFFGLLTLYAFMRFAPFLTEGGDDRPRWPWLLIGSLSLAVGYCFGKEIIVGLAPAFWCGWLGVLLVGKRARPARRPLLMFAVACTIVSLGCLQINRVMGVRPPGEGTYTGNFFRTPDSWEVVWNFVQYFSHRNADVLLLMATVLLLGIVGLLSLKRTGPNQRHLLLLVSYAFAAGVCLLYLMFWAVYQIYYMYPVVAFAALALGLGLPAIDEISNARFREAGRFIVRLALLATAFEAVPAHFNRASAHRAWNEVNSEMMKMLAQLPPQSEVRIALEAGHESIPMLQGYLRSVHGRTDIDLHSMHVPSTLNMSPSRPCYLLVPFGLPHNDRVGGRGLNPPSVDEWQSLNHLPVATLQQRRTSKLRRYFVPEGPIGFIRSCLAPNPEQPDVLIGRQVYYWLWWDLSVITP